MALEAKIRALNRLKNRLCLMTNYAAAVREAIVVIDDPVISSYCNSSAACSRRWRGWLIINFIGCGYGSRQSGCAPTHTPHERYGIATYSRVWECGNMRGCSVTPKRPKFATPKGGFARVVMRKCAIPLFGVTAFGRFVSERSLGGLSGNLT